jgi:hypothetical protein
MQTVNVKRDELLKKIMKNREEHRQAFEESVNGFKKEYKKKLSQMLEDAEVDDTYDTNLTLKFPSHHLSEYDQVITMLEMSTDETIKLSDREFSSYVMDNWNWQQSWLRSNSLWSGIARQKSAIYTMGAVTPKTFDL